MEQLTHTCPHCKGKKTEKYQWKIYPCGSCAGIGIVSEQRNIEIQDELGLDNDPDDYKRLTTILIPQL